MAALRPTVMWRPHTTPRITSLERRAFSVSVDRRATWGFIGLGRMGYQMAKNLRAKVPAEDTLYIHDLIPETLTKFQEEARASGHAGAKVQIADCVRDIADSASTIITVLPEPSHVKNVFSQLLQPSSAPPPSARAKLFIDCSTIDPASSREVARAVHTTLRGHFVDAPLSGGVIGATAGTLTFMVGCAPALLPALHAVLLRMGARVVHCGARTGAGLAGKLANNYLLAIANIATAEAMQLGVRAGLDARVLAGVINASTGRCWPSELNNPVRGVVAGAPAGRDYSGGFSLALMRKDLALAVGVAGEVGAELVLAERALEVYEGAERDEACRGRDFSVVYRFLGGEEA